LCATTRDNNIMAALSRAQFTSALLLLFAQKNVEARQVQFHVDPIAGDDATGDGSATAPFKTLPTAQEAARDTYPGGAPSSLGVSVVLHNGTFDVSAKPLTLKAEDSGVSYISAQDATPVLSAGARLDPSSFYSVSDRPDLIAFNLTALVPIEKLGNLKTGALGECANGKAEVFVNGSPLWLARFPNVEETGLFAWSSISDVCDGMANPGTSCVESFSWDNIDKVFACWYLLDTFVENRVW